MGWRHPKLAISEGIGWNSERFEPDEANPLLRVVVCNNESAPPMPASRPFTDALVAQLPSLRRYAVGLVGNTAPADDLVQDCMERALRQEAQLREPDRLGGWLRRILYHLYIDGIRRALTNSSAVAFVSASGRMTRSAPSWRETFPPPSCSGWRPSAIPDLPPSDGRLGDAVLNAQSAPTWNRA